MNKISQILFFVVGVMSIVIWSQHKRTVRISGERDNYRSNTEILLSDIKHMQIDSTTTAVDVKALRLTVDEYERYRASDVAIIEKMGVKIKDLESVSRHEVEIKAPIAALITDTVIIEGNIPIPVKAINMQTPHLSMNGIIRGNELIGEINLPVTLHQSVWIEYKRHWLLWRRVKAVHQTISSDNPHVKIDYSEYIKIQK